VFDLKLWDHPLLSLNIKGRICMVYSLFWVILGYANLHYLQQSIWWLVDMILGRQSLGIFMVCFSVFFFSKVISNSYELMHIRFLKRGLVDLLEIPNLQRLHEVGKKANVRISLAFPNILKTEVVSFLERIRKRVVFSDGFIPYKKAIGLLLHGHVVYEDQEGRLFYHTIEDLLANRKVQSMSTIHHHHTSTLEHSLVISQASWYLADAFGLDKASCARGALLHDFFLYDWRDRKHSHHATQHAGIALDNAQKYFDLNEMEKDIILTHMWPLSKSFYKYRESLLVSLVDKLGSSKDLVSMLKHSE